MAPHSSTLAWKITCREEPGGLQPMGSLRVRYDWAFTFHFHALEKEMAAHSSVLAWRIRGMGEPGGLPSLGSHRVGHDWSDLAAAAAVAWIYFCSLQEKIGSVWPPRGQPCSSDLLCDEAKLWRMGGRLSGSTWHLQAGPSASLQLSILSLSSSSQAAAVLPWKKIHQEENGARGSESAWGVTGGTPCRTHLLWTQFMFGVCKYNSRLVTWALLSHLQDVTCRVMEGQGLSLSRLWPGITSYCFCWVECGPVAPIQLQKKAKECTLHVCKGRRKASFLYPIFNSSPSQPHTPHPSTSLCLRFSFP